MSSIPSAAGPHPNPLPEYREREQTPPSATFGIVAIGRNEGERLRTCLTAATSIGAARVVYVDSGSTDGSRQLARSLHADVVELDLSIPFTAARSRNEGFAKLIELQPDVEFVQFIDGDCELRPDWCDRAIAELNAKPKAAVVCGRRRERHPDATVYNKLCDIEWNTPVGQAQSCGGDAMFRVSAFKQAGGYNPDVIAGEEPELCARLREKGWEVWRVDAEMTLHDAAMTQLGQWWKRNYRAGHAYAEGNARHGQAPDRFWEKEVKSNKVWGTAALLPFLWPLHVALCAEDRPLHASRPQVADERIAAIRRLRRRRQAAADARATKILRQPPCRQTGGDHRIQRAGGLIFAAAMPASQFKAISRLAYVPDAGA
ncbi:MAG: glycosyltransferase family A protein [Tepidisphaeraceae bacterium]